MGLAVGEIFEGKVTGITKFGAFVSLPENKSGMVHISEVANTFVDDIKNFLTEGQEVRVKIMAIDEQGRINLSIKKVQEGAGASGGARPAQTRPAQARTYNNNHSGGARPAQPREGGGYGGGRPAQNRDGGARPPRFNPREAGKDDDDDSPRKPMPRGTGRRTPPPVRDPDLTSFEDNLKMFMTTSESRKGHDRKNSRKRSK